MKLPDLEIFTMTDQPEACSQCGSRTEFMELKSGSQLHVCLNKNCWEVFIVEEDDNDPI